MPRTKHGKNLAFVENAEVWEATPVIHSPKVVNVATTRSTPSITIHFAWRTDARITGFCKYAKENKNASRNVQRAYSLCNNTDGGNGTTSLHARRETKTFLNEKNIYHSTTQKIHQNPKPTHPPHKRSDLDESSGPKLWAPETTVRNNKLTNSVWAECSKKKWREKRSPQQNRPRTICKLQEHTRCSDIWCGTHTHHLRMRLTGCEIIPSSCVFPSQIQLTTFWHRTYMNERTHVTHWHQKPVDSQKQWKNHSVSNSTIFLPSSIVEHVNRIAKHLTIERLAHTFKHMPCHWTNQNALNNPSKSHMNGWLKRTRIILM